MINCVYARRLNEVRMEAFEYECGNRKSPMHLKLACNAYCSRCKVRDPIQQLSPPVIDKMPKAKQMTLEDWLQ